MKVLCSNRSLISQFAAEDHHGMGPRDVTVWFALVSDVGILRHSGFRSERAAAGDAGHEIPAPGPTDSWPWTPATTRFVGSAARRVENVATLRLRRVAG